MKESQSWGVRTRLPSVSGLEITWKKERSEADFSRGRCASQHSFERKSKRKRKRETVRGVVRDGEVR